MEINLVKHDTSSSVFNMEGYGSPAYIEVHLKQMPKDKSGLVLDLGNYIYNRFNIAYDMCPEFRGNGENSTIRWFVPWKHLKPLQDNICKYYDKKVLAEDYLPLEFQSIPLQKAENNQVAIWKKTGELVLYRQKQSGSEIEFNVGNKKFVYLQAELGPISDFEILSEF